MLLRASRRSGKGRVSFCKIQEDALMLAILELTFLVQAGLDGKPQTHLFTKGAAAVQHEKFELVVYHRKLRCGFFNHGILLRFPQTQLMATIARLFANSLHSVSS
jgi:hypothetical protein